MKDRYPVYPALPSNNLVPPESQPEYLELPGRVLEPTANLADALVDAHVREGRGDAVAAIHHESDRVYTFRDLQRESARLANALTGLGIRPGDRVAFRSANRPEALITALATWRLGAVVVPAPAQARAPELRFFLQDTGARVLIADPRPDLIQDVPAGIENTAVERVITFDDWRDLLTMAADRFDGPPVSADSLAIIWHTGGTTGVPKACYHTQRRFLLGGYAVGEATGVQMGERWAAAAPVGHALGFIYYTIYTLLHGATVVLVENFHKPEVVLNAIARHRIDTFTAISASWARMLEVIHSRPDEFATTSIKRAYAMWQSASSTEVYDGWHARGVELLNNFGSTAFATWVLAPRPGDRVPTASLGRPSPGYRVTAIDAEARGVNPVPVGTIGRMAVQGPTGLTYWNRPEFQQRDVRDGWTLVDDLIRFDEHGNAAYLGRTDFVISTAGYKVAPVEVEEILATHSAVREVAVVGAPDPIRQEIVMAFVALNEHASANDELRSELQDLVKSQLSPYKYPRRIEFVAALPRDPVGKVQSRVLKEWAAGA
jgi:2-aminobenzoate-CoA ligase